MFTKSVLKQMLYIFISVFPVLSRKYDLEAEAMKLYREPLRVVVQRFRRSPEYLKILKDRQINYNFFMEDVLETIAYHYIQKLEAEIKQMMEITDPPPTTPNTKRLFNYRRADKNITRVERLDKYSKLTSLLTLKERNRMRDLAFEICGQMIHEAIYAIGKDFDEVKSTRLPYGGNDERKETNTHAAVHSVTHSPTKPLEPIALSEENSVEQSTHQSKFMKQRHSKINNKKYST